MQYALPLVLPDVPAGGVCAGIDWATADHAACVAGLAGRVTDRFSAARDKAGIAALITRLRGATSPRSPSSGATARWSMPCWARA